MRKAIKRMEEARRLQHKLRSDLPATPAMMAHLPIDERGYPVPWFVSWIDGKPEFRTAEAHKREQAIAEKLCWVCGQRLDRNLAYVIGPMCMVNRITAEPPCHLECAWYSVKACPFLTKPQMVRRENNLPANAHNPGGEMIERNPGCFVIWVTRTNPKKVNDGRGGYVLAIGPPDKCFFTKEGRTATIEEVRHSITTGLPNLERLAQEDGPAAVLHLGELVGQAFILVDLFGGKK